MQCQLPDHIFKWGITIEDSHYGLIQGNVLQNWVGGLATVTGSESYNVIEGNLVMRSKQGDHFWLNGTRNYFRNNVGASAKTGNVYYVPINLDSDRMFSVPAYRAPTPHSRDRPNSSCGSGPHSWSSPITRSTARCRACTSTTATVVPPREAIWSAA